MLLSRLLANFTRGESDTLRKAMGKKLIDKMNHLKGKFMEGGQANGHKPEVLDKIWKDWEKFASYAFNKSHATCYSWVAFQTAYLKANYPAEYMAAVLSRNKNDNAKLTVFMDECKAMKIKVKGPDINESFSNFGVNAAGDIRFGMSAIKGVGEGIVNAIIAERRANGPFKDIYDVVERVDISAGLNRRTLENMVLAGVFDCFADDIKREDFFETNSKDESFSEQLIRYGQAYQRDKQEQTSSLFDMFADDMSISQAGRPPIKPAVPWVKSELLTKERDLVGMYLSAHPLEPYYMELTYGCTSIKEFTDEETTPIEDREVRLGGMVVNFETRPGNKGPWGILKMEDLTGSTEMRLFGQTYAQFNGYCTTGQQIIVTGKYQRRYGGEELRFNITDISLLSNRKGNVVSGITIFIDSDTINPALAEILSDASSTIIEGEMAALKIMLYDPALNRRLSLTGAKQIALNKRLIDKLESLDIEYHIN